MIAARSIPAASITARASSIRWSRLGDCRTDRGLAEPGDSQRPVIKKRGCFCHYAPVEDVSPLGAHIVTTLLVEQFRQLRASAGCARAVNAIVSTTHLVTRLISFPGRQRFPRRSLDGAEKDDAECRQLQANGDGIDLDQT
jgi:hypothetical protein